MNDAGREAISNFRESLSSLDTENSNLQSRNRILSKAQAKLRLAIETVTTEKDTIIAKKDAIIAHKDMLITQYKKYLAVHEIFIDEETGDLVLGRISKRGMVEDDEDGQVDELKKRKVDLHAKVNELEEYKKKLTAEIGSLEVKKTLDEHDIQGMQIGRLASGSDSRYYSSGSEPAPRADNRSGCGGRFIWYYRGKCSFC